MPSIVYVFPEYRKLRHKMVEWRYTCARLPICENGTVIPIQYRFDEITKRFIVEIQLLGAESTIC